MGVIGAPKALGSWEEQKVLLMNDEGFPMWKVDVEIDQKEVPFEYKYIIYSVKEQKVVTWESGANRYFPLHDLSGNKKLVVQTDEFFSYPVGNWKAAGVAIPVFFTAF